MKNITDKLISLIKQKNTPLLVGLDPDISKFPDFLKCDTYENISDSIFNFNKIIIDATHDLVPAIKPQLAYYEIYGSHGIIALERTLEYAKSKGLFIINDGKRGDIKSTATAYAEAFLSDKPMASDMVTINPYLGADSYMPFIEKANENGRGVFLLLKTSNPSSIEFQDVKSERGVMMYVEFMERINEMTKNTDSDFGYSNIGVVVGATFPEEIKVCRDMLKKAFFLVPGFGAQGGDANMLKYAFNSDGLGALINSSRGIIFSYTSRDNYKKLTDTEIYEIVRNKTRDDIKTLSGIF